MAFDDLSMVERFKHAVEELVKLGTIQDRFDAAIFHLEPLRFEDFPEEITELYKPIHEAIESGVEPGEIYEQKAVQAALRIVEISHRLTALQAGG